MEDDKKKDRESSSDADSEKEEGMVRGASEHKCFLPQSIVKWKQREIEYEEAKRGLIEAMKRLLVRMGLTDNRGRQQREGK